MIVQVHALFKSTLCSSSRLFKSTLVQVHASIKFTLVQVHDCSSPRFVQVHACSSSGLFKLNLVHACSSNVLAETKLRVLSSRKKRPKNREDSSDLDENWTKSIAAMKTIISISFWQISQKNCAKTSRKRRRRGRSKSP